tara:strand:- start:2834 stop:3256 length:423 start_codon:yes stop_codon:yes gene_type:complete
MKTIKKFGILLLTVLIVACSDDDSNGDDNPDTSSSTYSFLVTASSDSDYTLVGTDANGEVSGNDPSITMSVGETISFSVNAANHPFYIKTVQGGGTSDQASGVSNNGATNGVVSWAPAAAGTYYYQCSDHNGMFGVITVQ